MNFSKRDKATRYILATINRAKGNVKENWSWDIYIKRSSDQEFTGKAKAPGKGVEIPWTKLVQQDFLEEMLEKCQEQMLKHP